jgi:hypothetical protein
MIIMRRLVFTTMMLRAASLGAAPQQQIVFTPDTSRVINVTAAVL